MGGSQDLKQSPFMRADAISSVFLGGLLLSSLYIACSRVISLLCFSSLGQSTRKCSRDSSSCPQRGHVVSFLQLTCLRPALPVMSRILVTAAGTRWGYTPHADQHPWGLICLWSMMRYFMVERWYDSLRRVLCQWHLIAVLQCSFQCSFFHGLMSAWMMLILYISAI